MLRLGSLKLPGAWDQPTAQRHLVTSKCFSVQYRLSTDRLSTRAISTETEMLQGFLRAGFRQLQLGKHIVHMLPPSA
jgi:hypothetical protein